MSFDVVIPNYNGSKLIKANLPKVIREIEKYNSKTIIVDDYSQKAEFEALSEFIKKLNNKNIILLRNEKNLGFSSTVNRGVKESDADFIVLLNTDVIPEKNFLEAALADLYSDENLYGVGFMDKSIERGETVLRGRGLAKWERGFLVHRRGDTDREDTFWISGGSSVFRRDLFEKFSGFDSLYDPFYWEDIDLSYRVRKSGYKIKFQPKSVVVHKHAKGAIKKHFTDFQVKTIAYRNQFIFVWKNITEPDLLISHLIWLPFHLVTSILRLDSAFITGFFLALVRLPDIIIKRSEQKKSYKLKDSDLLRS